MVTHFSTDGGNKALCNTVAKKGSLVVAFDPSLVTCKKCLKKMEKVEAPVEPKEDVLKDVEDLVEEEDIEDEDLDGPAQEDEEDLED